MNKEVLSDILLQTVGSSLRRLLPTLPPPPNGLAVKPRLNSSEDADEYKNNHLHILAETQGVEAEGRV